MKPVLEIHYVQVKAIPIYSCVGCQTTERGSTVRMEFPDLGPDARPSSLATIVEGRTVFNSHLPEGWSGNGIYEHRCPSCTTKRTFAPCDTAGEMLDIGQAEAIHRMNRPDSMDFS